MPSKKPSNEWGGSAGVSAPPTRENREMSLMSEFASEMSLDFAGKMDQLAERDISESLSQLWLGVRSESRLREAQQGPQTGWNPYRPARGGINAKRDILNSQIVEFESVVPVISLYIQGSAVTIAEGKNSPRRKSRSIDQEKRFSLSNSLFPPSEYKCVHIPNEKERSLLQIKGATMPIRRPTKHSEAVEEILAWDGCQPVEVLNMDRSAPSEKGESVDHSRAEEDFLEPKEQAFQDLVDLVFRDVWSTVVVPFYLENLSEEQKASRHTPPPDSFCDEVQLLTTESTPIPKHKRVNSLVDTSPELHRRRPRPTTGPASRKESIASPLFPNSAGPSRHSVEEDTVLSDAVQHYKRKQGLEARTQSGSARLSSQRQSSVVFAQDLEGRGDDGTQPLDTTPESEKEEPLVRPSTSTAPSRYRATVAQGRAEAADQMAAVYGLKRKKGKRKKSKPELNKTTGADPSPLFSSQKEKNGDSLKESSREGNTSLLRQDLPHSRTASPVYAPSSTAPSGRRHKELLPVNPAPAAESNGRTTIVGVTQGSLLANRNPSARRRRLEPLVKKGS